jgi:hypothetical protein
MTKTCKKCGETKPRSCFRAATGNYGDGLRGKCISCSSTEAKIHGELNKAAKSEYNKRYRSKNRETLRAYDRKRSQDPKRKAAKKEYEDTIHRLNPTYRYDRNKRLYHADPQKHTAYVAKRRAEKIQATPAWANTFFMEEAYRLATLRTKMFGFAWNVDHIVPLRSKLVCGLHVETNFQVIPGIENNRKSNIYWPDMPGSP